MPKNKASKESRTATLACVKKEMAKPRVAKSARTKYANLLLSAGSTEAGKPPARDATESRFEGKLLQK
jgi:hypothetical protein